MMETVFNLAFRALNGGRTPDQKRQHKREIAHAEEKFRILEQRPSPLPLSRKNLSQSSLSTHPQKTSPLFAKLPPEVRQRIWTLVLGGHYLHLTSISKRIAHRQLLEQDFLEPTGNKGPPTGNLPLPIPPTVQWLDESHRIPQPGEFSSLPIALLQTCHAIYAEAIPILYNSNIFSLASPLVLLYLEDYTLRPQHFAEIGHLRLIPWVYFSDPAHHTGKIHEPYDADTWPRFWEVVAQMELKSFGLWLEYWGQEEGCSIEADWVKPVLQLHGLEEVGIHIQLRMGPWDWKRMHGMEETIEKAWTAPH